MLAEVRPTGKSLKSLLCPSLSQHLTADKIQLQTKYSSLEVFRFLGLQGPYLPGGVMAGVFLSSVLNFQRQLAQKGLPQPHIYMHGHTPMCAHILWILPLQEPPHHIILSSSTALFHAQFLSHYPICSMKTIPKFS